MTEVEVKIPVDDLREAERRVRSLGFEPVRPTVFERNTLYDNAAFDLRAGKKVLRIREVGERTILTSKAPPIEGGPHKVREEREVEVSDAREMHGILATLGYRPAWRYEKRRTTFRRGEESGVIEIDDTPIGGFLEIEGAPNWIDETAEALGFKPVDYSTASYYTLFLEWRERTGSDVEHMAFV